MNSLPGSSSILDCSCNPGWTGPDTGPCLPCDEGFYKEALGSEVCTECPPGTYSSSISAISIQACITCPDKTMSPSGSLHVDDCVCALGYYGPPGGPCVPQCGDGLHVEEEGCDDSNLAIGDGCSELCMVECGFVCILPEVDAPSQCTAECGDGLRKGSEQCDDGNGFSEDGCSSQ